MAANSCVKAAVTRFMSIDVRGSLQQYRDIIDFLARKFFQDSDVPELQLFLPAEIYATS
jgi:hypothetical protein